MAVNEDTPINQSDAGAMHRSALARILCPGSVTAVRPSTHVRRQKPAVRFACWLAGLECRNHHPHLTAAQAAGGGGGNGGWRN
eukprot:2399909-Prymnesium_polylepis.1